MIMKKLWKMAPVATLLVGMMAAPLTQAEDVVKIGVAGPHTGAYAAFGEQLWKGAEAAANDINEAGGIDGKKIELVKADDACEPKQAVSVANRLVDNDKVVAVVGHFCSSSTMPASEIYDEANIIDITPASTNPQVTERGLKTIMRTCGRDDQQGNVAGDYIVNQLKAKKVAVIHDKDTYGQGLADATKARMNELGLEEVLYEGLTRGEKDFNALVTKIKSVDADVVYFGGLHSEAGPLVRQLREQGSKATFISGDGIVSEDFVVAAGGGEFVDGVLSTFGRDPRTIPEGKAVVDKFKAAGYEPEGYTLYSYAAMQAIADAIKGSGSTDGDKLTAWLESNGADTVMGKKEWDEKGDLKVSDYVMYRWDKDGKYTMIEE
ncbi:MAG: branched-chain amino acid ABC transporter substrate-binding protein [Thiothrix sp.]|nr:branched-chain amino acid ABC transporter substrate-binding protein [Thiothrix sp.]HPQ95324.1 branched-chain amino acid ABC transporter substrate-binding protein [Thiolinea sp.]